MKLPLRLLAAALALFAPLSMVAQKASVPIADADAAKHVGEEAIVSGKVAAVTTSGKGTTFLNFGDRFPRQIFSGVIFAQDTEKVGDVKQYEGKTVSVSGRIEMSPDQKPQIVITVPGQIKLADGAPASPPVATSSVPTAPPPTAPPAPATIPAMPLQPATSTPALPAPVAATAERKISLAANWNSPTQAGAVIRKDLAMLFAGLGTGSATAESGAPISVYQDIAYLTPLGTARKLLKLENSQPAKGKITCPGLPLGSLTAHIFSGVFEGGYTRLVLVTDLADQVVSVQLVDENSRQRTPEITDTLGYHTYNFVSQRVKGTNDLVVRHQPETARGVVVVESMLIDPNDTENPPGSRSPARTSAKPTARSSRTGKVLERSRWYVPVPMVDLILRCSGNR